MECADFENESLWINLSEEYQKAIKSKKNSELNAIDKKLRTVRIFISSTFRDFHNERNLLVTKIFPRLREWCYKHGLYLVECDLRWGIPTYVSREETLITCFEEIERGRSECNNMNFFLGLIGDRYGWIPERKEITEYVRKRYDWIENSSVTLMEFIHGMIRTLTPNGLIMIRSANFIELLPDHHKSDFIENDIQTIKSLNLFKNFLINKFSDQGLIHFYEPNFESIIFDKFLEKNRVLLKGLEAFGEIVENYFTNCIKNNLLKFVENCDIKNDLHRMMVRGCGKLCTIRHKSYLQLFDYLKSIQHGSCETKNPIVVLSGTAGMGKSTILAYCVKELENLIGYEVFFHSVSCTTSSQHIEEIVNRIYRFLNGTEIEDETIDEKYRKINEILINGVKTLEQKVYYIVLDGLDELSQGSSLCWIPSFTNSQIVIVLSTLVDNDPISFYSKLKNVDRKIKEIEIESMYKDELSYIVSNYLLYFGKRLEPDQMKSLLNFSSSKNPLWLISACEQLRIHGDYKTLNKLILSLPSNIKDLNKLIIRRNMNQDSTNLIRSFLKLLIISRSGVWENVVRDMLAFIMNYEEPVCNTTWLDIVRQLKGFLLIESIPLPLIKFRHRVMKESINEELNLKTEEQQSMHLKMADFFQQIIQTENSLFLSDYFFHLIKSNSRNRLIEFMRSMNSWKLFNQMFVRSKVLMSMRCNYEVAHSTETNTDNALVMCTFCSLQRGELSVYAINKDCCYYCGALLNNTNYSNRLPTCRLHEQIVPNMKKCVLCDKSTYTFQSEYVRMCQLCKMMTFTSRCSVIVKETDVTFKQQLQCFNNSDLEHLI